MSRPTRSAAAFLAFAAVAVATGSAGASEINEVLRQRLETIHETGKLSIGGQRIAAVRVLPVLYANHEFELFWTRPGMVERLMAAIAAAPDHGLDPSDYHFEALRDRIEIAGSGLRGVTSLVDLDLLLTDALARYAATLHFGKLDPVELDPVWNLSREFADADVVERFSEVLAKGTITEYLASVAPQFAPYHRLKSGLAIYRQLAASGGWPTVPDGPALKPGERDRRVADLRARLAVTDGLVSGPGDDFELFDGAVEEAVKRFQRRHGLDEDSKVGPKTLEALNVPVEARIDQIRVNLERERWVFRDIPDDFIVADIAGFRLLVYRNRKQVWTTKIQVGKPYHATPVFKGEMTYLVLNPTWTVPPGILRNETLPAIRKDPGYLAKQNMSVIRSDGSVVDPSTVDFSGSFPYGIRQEPGPSNALGRVKFMFPNPYFVYLHDTPSKGLFGRSARAFSHGCIRTEDPLYLAELLLAGQAWDRARIDAVIDSGKITTVTLDEPLAVFLLYWTADVWEDGTIAFREDIYDRDAKIIEGLDEPFSFKVPSNLPTALR